MLTKIRSLCLEIRAMKEESKTINNISKLPEFANHNKNSHRTDYSNVKGALHYNDYEDNKYAPQTRLTEDTPSTDQRYEAHPAHKLSALTPDLLKPSHNSSPGSPESLSDSDKPVCSSRAGMS
jgi:hypothetical protein